MEVVLDRGVNGGKLLRGLDVPELRNDSPLVVGTADVILVFGPVIEPTPTLLTPHDADDLHRGTGGCKRRRKNPSGVAVG
jgi:hypothetical protein